MTIYTDTFDHRGQSYNAAMAAFPEARNEERACLLRLLDPQPGERIIDCPAGGGFVAEALIAVDVEVVCIEPSAPFGEPLAAQFTTCCDLRDHIPTRSYALFQARLALQELGESLKAERRGR